MDFGHPCDQDGPFSKSKRHPTCIGSNSKLSIFIKAFGRQIVHFQIGNGFRHALSGVGFEEGFGADWRSKTVFKIDHKCAILRRTWSVLKKVLKPTGAPKPSLKSIIVRHLTPHMVGFEEGFEADWHSKTFVKTIIINGFEERLCALIVCVCVCAPRSENPQLS